MTIETALWVVGAIIGPGVGWAVHMTIVTLKQRDDLRILVEMHRKPDDHGFGTTRTNRIIEDNTRAMQALTHYIQWLVKQQTGTMPPPPLAEVPTRGAE